MMRTLSSIIALLLLCVGLLSQAFAHESQPGLLQLTQQDSKSL